MVRHISKVVLGLFVLALIAVAAPRHSTVLAQSTPAATTDASLTSIKFGAVTPVADYWPVYIAKSKNLFEKHGLSVEVIYFDTTSKVAQAQASAAVDISAVSTDTAINAQEKGAAISQIAGLNNKLIYSLIVAKDIKSFADLKGKTLAVSDLKDGSTLILAKLLAANGLTKDDYSFLPLGGTGKRAAGLTTGQVSAALIGIPNYFTLLDQGYESLAFTTDLLPDYQWESVIALNDWLKDHKDTAVNFLKALNDATAWLYDPANKDEAIDILAKELKLKPEIAAKAYDAAVVKFKFYPKQGEFTLEGFKAVIQVMGEQKLLWTPLPDPSKYIDTTYIDAAAGK